MTINSQTRSEIGRLLVRGQDRPGIVSGVSTLLAELGANIVSLDQYSTDPESGRFFQRTEFHMPDLGTRIDELRVSLVDKLGSLGLDWELVEATKRKRVAIFVSKIDHCLLDLLWRHRRGDFNIDISMVISNHPDLGDDVRQFNIPYIHVPVAKDDKATAERRHLELLKGNVDFVVLARYMQILSSDFLDQVGVPVINIHHSFLPAFIGAGPYQKAKERGVKLIGATAHYVTEDLDEGPIIEQDVVRVTHANTAAELMQRGADVERLVLAKAVAWHSEDRILRDGNTTIIFRK
ncbi:formyltetrahydrofolate deformylase [Paenarthrobacter sp. TYUT067]|uniref:formyltetrahydrofolate deformylase n=1 Tax=Paenarthrobacter sp. TYUT067 TaxID=2926245 RepID=UPI002030F9C1|nr:formyltetrahydrofolate deformylase [Paenarthrobacter sp. TYUT067]MCM0618560.1 formyltetrahydrofolate deformylase [Paenarthrobacter sp. TYUT067]